MVEDRGRDHDEEVPQRPPNRCLRFLAVLLLLALCATFMGVILWLESAHLARMAVYDQNISIHRQTMDYFHRRGNCSKDVIESDPWRTYLNCDMENIDETNVSLICKECPDGWHKIKGGWNLEYCYKLFKEKLDWQSARRRCLDESADLAFDMRYSDHYHNKRMHTFYKGELGDKEKKELLWVGLHNLTHRYSWVNNVEMHKMMIRHFRDKEDDSKPNDTRKDDKFCVGLSLDLVRKENKADSSACKEPNYWNCINIWLRLNCSDTHYFLCEKPFFDYVPEAPVPPTPCEDDCIHT